LARVIDEDPQTKEREMIVDMIHPTLGAFKFVNTPLRFRNSRASVDEPPPVSVGEHTDSVLREMLMLEDEEVQRLRREGVVFGPTANP
jgi:crotonobetainyl-CoA:carnitine CoA-transferase CaiB-like acyl-CoA transferase